MWHTKTKKLTLIWYYRVSTISYIIISHPPPCLTYRSMGGPTPLALRHRVAPPSNTELTPHNLLLEHYID